MLETEEGTEIYPTADSRDDVLTRALCIPIRLGFNVLMCQSGEKSWNSKNKQSSALFTKVRSV